MRLCALLLTAGLLSRGAALEPQLEVRLETHLTSYASKPGTPFRCVVIRDLRSDGRVVVPEGSIVSGTVRKAVRVGMGFVHERAALQLAFTSIETPDGRVYPVDASLVAIDNAREEVTASGRIKGVLAANNPGNLLNGFWVRPTSNLAFRSLVGLTGAANQIWARYSMGPFGAAGLFAARCVLMSFPEPEIHLPPGTDFKLRVRVPEAMMEAARRADWNASDTLLEASDIQMAGTFSSWLENRLSPITYANGQPTPDLFNVILLGTRQRILSAFLNSGWAQADARSWGTSSRVYMAFSGMRSYDSAPVSPLLYRGAQPDLVFEKSLDTVTQRHHIRFWRAGQFEGEEVWLGAATHDIGLTFHLTSFAFSHKIDTKLDKEREKVFTDLHFAGCTGEPLLLPSPAAHRQRTKQPIVTDNRILLLAVRPCEGTGSYSEPPLPPGNRATRLTRRVVLETRNYLLRDNAYYWGYRFFRSYRNGTNPLVH